MLRETLEQKELERGQLASLCAMAQDAWRRQDQTRALALKEMEELVAALQAALASSTKDLEVGSPLPRATQNGAGCDSDSWLQRDSRLGITHLAPVLSRLPAGPHSEIPLGIQCTPHR